MIIKPPNKFKISPNEIKSPEPEGAKGNRKVLVERPKKIEKYKAR